MYTPLRLQQQQLPPPPPAPPSAPIATIDGLREVLTPSKILVPRMQLERWCHEPFFADLVKDCFVRIGIGVHEGVQVYRCAKVTGVKEARWVVGCHFLELG